ncbi:DUF3967 domain-containing protein [Bacillus thuringiensis]|uniref:DUF3967 domain-containing protein n=1 Tax=Bacillus thuringiensis TaxID=1428 RepID=UPI0010AC522E|nr:DUF3967 domain-containing protein [Bacillus thuringiensis]TJZ99683.1 DUF3967 domain-containing protein [Bacillus thuringiensis]
MQQQFHQYYSVITKKLDQSMVEMEKQIKPYHKRGEKKWDAGDQNLIKILRDIQETKKFM